MRYVLYFFTMLVLFVGGMMVGNMYLPDRGASLSATVAVPPLSSNNPALQEITREIATRNLDVLNQALSSCPVVVGGEKDRLLNQIKLRMALENFEFKRTKLELEIAKNKEINRPTAQFTQALNEYNQARLQAEKLADELFPVVEEEPGTPPDGESALADIPTDKK